MDANVNIGLNVDSSGAERSVGSLKSQLRAAQAEVAALSDKFGATSVEAANAARKAAEIADAIGDAKRLTDAFNPDAKFTALTRSFGGVLNGFQAFEGALGTLGVESEDLQRQLLKVQSAMALSQGLQGLMEAKDDFKILGSVIKNTVVSAFTTLRGAIISTGIGALVVAVGYLVNEYLEMSEAENKAAEEQKKLNEQLKKQKEFVSTESTQFIRMISMLKATNKGSKERKDLIKDINKQYGTTLKNLSDEASFQRQLNLEVDNYIKYKMAEYALKVNDEKIQKLTEKRTDLQKQVNKAQSDYNDILAQYQRKQAGVTVMQVEYARTTLQEQKDKLDENSDALKYFGKTALDAATEISSLTLGGKKFVEGQGDLKTATETTTEVINYQKEIVDEQIKLIEDENQRKQTQLVVEAERRKKEVQDSKASADEKAQYIKLIDENLLQDLDALDKEYYAKYEETLKEKNQKIIDADKIAKDLLKQQESDFLDQIEKLQEDNFLNSLSEQDRELQLVQDKYFELETMAQDNAEQLKIIAEAKGNEIDAINKKYNDKELEDAEKVNRAKMSMAADSIGGLVDLIVMFGADNEKNARKQFEINKKASIANAVINTFKAVTNALASDPPPFSYINAGIAAFTGMAQVTKIKNTKFEAPQDVEKPPAGTPPAAPENMGTFQPGQFTTIGSTKSSSGSGGKSTKVYVLESDITQVQGKVSVIESRSILGG